MAVSGLYNLLAAHVKCIHSYFKDILIPYDNALHMLVILQ